MSTFRLGRLLDLSTRQEKDCLYGCQRAEARRRAVEQRVESLTAAVAANGHDPGDLLGAQLHQSWAHRRALGEQTQAQRVALRRAEFTCAEAQVAYMAARQQRQMLETLEERFDTQMRAERIRKEQAVLDEAGLRRFWQGGPTALGKRE